MKPYKNKLHLLAILLLSQIGFAQSKTTFPTVGKLIPDFELTDLHFYPKKKVSNKDLKGKWYILDFWIMGCKPCIANFPKVDALVKQFKNRIEIIQVGIGGNELKQYYEAIRKKQGLNIPMAFDGVLSNKWQISAYPTIFIIDDKGVLRVITHELSSEKLNALFNRDKDNFAKSLYKEHYQNDIKKLYFVNNNGANDTTFLLRTFTQWYC
ncbi:Thiol-disulfide oxidoreductase ResA [compost metagenome]